jgi:hypothetical protein
MLDVEQVKAELSKVRPDQYDWDGLVQAHGFDSFVEVVASLTPDALTLIPKLPKGHEGSPGESIPQLHKDVLWMYGVFLSMYQRNKSGALAWFRESLQGSMEIYGSLFKGQPWVERSDAGSGAQERSSQAKPTP